jgi:mRNA interferase RelE/StbE
LRIDYKASVEGDLKRIGRQAASRLVDQLEEKLSSEGRRAGIPLKGEFAGLYRLRVGEYRVIYAITNDSFLVLRIVHRKDVYRGSRPGR